MPIGLEGAGYASVANPVADIRLPGEASEGQVRRARPNLYWRPLLSPQEDHELVVLDLGRIRVALNDPIFRNPPSRSPVLDKALLANSVLPR
jgi:hypothetical protein